MSAQLLEEFLSYLSVEKGLRPKSTEAYRRDILDLIDFFNQKNRVVSEPGIDSILTLFMVHLHDLGLSARSIARKSSSIKGFYKFLLREGHISEDPTTLIERPKTGKKLPKVLNISEIESLINQPDTSTVLGLRDWAILETLYATGIRESELIGLKIEDFNKAAEFLTVTGKGDKQRIIPVGSFAIESIKNYLNTSRPKLLTDLTERTLFLNTYGKSLSRMGLWKIIRKHALKAGLANKVSPHTFRHSCATHMLEGGAGIIAVQEILGHVDISTTQIYTHLTSKDLKNIHRQSHPRGK